MPYRINPNDKREVQKQQDNGNWVRLAKHNTAGAAQQHLAALKINVESKEE